MKNLMILLAVAIFAAPAVGLADPQNEGNAKVDFNAKCAKCHRATKSLPNTAKLLGVDPGKLTLRTSKMNREEMIAIIEKGRDKMPGFENELTKERIANIVDYIFFLKKRSNVRSGTPTRLY